MYQANDSELATATRRIRRILREGGITSTEEVDDFTQSILMRAAETCNPGRSPFVCWVCDHARWWLSAHWEKKDKQPALIEFKESDELSEQPDYAHELRLREVVSSVEAMLRSGKEADLLSAYWHLLLQDLKLSEIALRLNITTERAAKAQKQLFYRIRKHFGCKNPKNTGPESRAILGEIL
ncbi:MAG TPA: hypothetical protein V6D47_09860 [Oscillatoriaceae cyanobacterium]